MKRKYTTPEAEIEKFVYSSNVLCGLSDGTGIENGGNNDDYDDDF